MRRQVLIVAVCAAAAVIFGMVTLGLYTALIPRQTSMLLHGRIAEYCSGPARVCRVNLANLMPFDWDRIIFVGPMPPVDVGSLIGVPGLPNNGVKSWIVFVQGDQVVWTDVLEVEPEGNPQHVFLDWGDMPATLVSTFHRNDAVFDARREYSGAVPWSLSSIELRHVDGAR